MSTRYKLDTDLNEAVKMAELLDDYVRSDQIYGYGGALFSNMPSMTIGALVLRLRRLDILREHLKDHQSKKLDKAVDFFMQVRTDWTYHYTEKMQKEAHSRLDTMKAFFYECHDNMRNCIAVYKPELMRRTIVQELVREMQELNIKDVDLMVKMSETDDKLRKITEASEFQWSEILKPVYDSKEFWWLYSSPPNLP